MTERKTNNLNFITAPIPFVHDMTIYEPVEREMLKIVCRFRLVKEAEQNRARMASNVNLEPLSIRTAIVTPNVKGLVQVDSFQCVQEDYLGRVARSIIG